VAPPAAAKASFTY